MPFIAMYHSVDPKRMLLGGVRASQSSRYELKQHAEDRLWATIDIHAKLDTPLVVEGEVVEVGGAIEIFADGSCIGCTWGQGGEATRARRAKGIRR